MTLVGCDPHSRKQQVAVLDTTTGEVLEQELAHDGGAAERFYRALTPPVTIGIETTGYTQWFHALMHQLGHTVLGCRHTCCTRRGRAGDQRAGRSPADDAYSGPVLKGDPHVSTFTGEQRRQPT